MRIAVVTDSTADLDAGWLRQHGVRTVPLTVEWGGESLRDRIDLTHDDFVRRLQSSRDLPRTAAPAPGVFAALYRTLLVEEAYDRILSIHIAGSLSATVRAAELAARLTDKERITVIDGQSASLGTAILVWWAVRRTAAGADPAQIAEEVAILSQRTVLVLAPVTLEYLARGGRIGQAAHLVGKLLNMTPILELDHATIRPVRKVRGERQMVPAILQQIRLKVPENSPVLAALSQSQNALAVKELEAGLRASYRLAGLLQGTIGPVIATHVGPGAYGAIVCPLTPQDLAKWQLGDDAPDSPPATGPRREDG